MTAKELRETTRDLYATVKVIPATINHSISNHLMNDNSSTTEFIDELISDMKYFENVLIHYRERIEEQKKSLINSFME